MKRFLSTLSAMLLAVSFTFAQTAPAAVQTVAEAADGPMMEFESKEVDYGTIIQEADPYRVFNFTNTGTEPLVIKHAKGSCGCTVPTYPKEPILPGESAEINVRYDTKRIGKFTKTVTLTTNEASEKHILRIKGEVKPKPTEPEAIPTSEGGF